jgi:predicted Zn-dependent protease with MMP-like domain
MIEVSDEQFQDLINQALESLNNDHANNIKNVAILYEQIPTPEQRQKLFLRNDQTLLGLYEGVPLTQRQGHASSMPDKITLFKGPLQMITNSVDQLEEQIRHTLWHEIAHYYGLNHDQIHNLE